MDFLSIFAMSNENKTSQTTIDIYHITSIIVNWTFPFITKLICKSFVLYKVDEVFTPFFCLFIFVVHLMNIITNVHKGQCEILMVKDIFKSVQ